MSQTASLNFQLSKLAAAVADLGSDPNSAKQLCLDHQSHPELGPDPNSAGHTNGVSRHEPTSALR